MTQDLIGEDELRTTLQRYAGPESPVAPLGQRRRRVRPALAVGVAVALAIAAGALTFALTRSSSGGGVSGSGSCAAVLSFRGSDYFGNKLHGVTLERGVSLGTAEQQGCGGTPAADVDVVALQGIDPAAAIARPGEPGVVYVARGRCAGFTDDRAFVACLRGGGS
jgi:hypothetical protein